MQIFFIISSSLVHKI